MSFRDELDRVIAEEERAADRLSRKQSRTPPKRSSSYKTRFEKPTYFAVLVGKILYRFRKPQKARQKLITPTRGMEGYVEGDFVEPPKITGWMIVKEDIRNFPKRLMRGGRKPKPPATKIPVSKESIEDWKEYFEDSHEWQGGSKRE